MLKNYTNETRTGAIANNIILRIKFGDNVTVLNNSGYALFLNCTNLVKAYNYPKEITTLTSALGSTKFNWHKYVNMI